MTDRRTDMAAEARDGAGPAAKGVSSRRYALFGLPAEEIDVRTPEASRLLSKPVGRYTTLDVSALIDRRENAPDAAARAVADVVGRLLPPDGGRPILAVGLGNRRITSDSIGPRTADRLLATRHLLRQLPDRFEGLRPVAVLQPGVLGTTGLESAETVCGLISSVPPCVCVLIDALASRSVGGLCRTIQISDTGVTPGSGVGNHRFEISAATVGVPCISVGVPTVVSVSAADFSEPGDGGELFVTPREIDALSELCSRAVAAGLNLAFQPGLSLDDLDSLLS
ncbi:MAG: GPR endopeptidase [Oscillospiraceae bacterium]|nr:GPR endopeptidase [Oscillospiraceae bacterium]